MKPRIWLDDTLPEMHVVPINPETGDIWIERMTQLAETAAAYRMASPNAFKARRKLEKHFDSLKAGVNFRIDPYFFRTETEICGSEAGEKILRITCHPNTFAKMPSGFRERYESVPAWA